MEKDIREYADIIALARPASKRHAPMPPENRAAQFAPYAALVGYEELVDEETRREGEEPPRRAARVG